MYKALFIIFVGIPALFFIGIVGNIKHNEAAIKAFVQAHRP